MRTPSLEEASGPHRKAVWMVEREQDPRAQWKDKGSRKPYVEDSISEVLDS